MARLLDPSFRYVPSSKVATEGVLARWLAKRKVETNMGESNTGGLLPSVVPTTKPDGRDVSGENRGALQVAHHSTKEEREQRAREAAGKVVAIKRTKGEAR
jgi:hypothetical protein